MEELFDKPREECGVFGILAPEGDNVARRIYYGLTALQHRGQEATGIAVSSTADPESRIRFHKNLGLVSEVFSPDILDSLKGNIGIGHDRYSTQGSNTVENAQPMVMQYYGGYLGLVHNGNIVNAPALKKDLMSLGVCFHSTSDTEVVASLLARESTQCDTVEEAVKRTASRLIGGYALVFMSGDKLVGVRDPLALKPLCIGRTGSSYVIASESCALNAVNAQFLRDVKPGEIITITPDGIHSDFIPKAEREAHCIFEYIYFARLDSCIDGIDVNDARIRGGRALAKAFPADADIVSGVPESGLAAAAGFSIESGIPYRSVFHKNSYIGRSFIKPTQEERETAVQQKLGLLSSSVRGKRVVLIDDSIVRGTTIRNLIRSLKNAGATEVHVRISSPPFLHPCYYGTNVPTTGELIASAQSEEQIRLMIGADSLHYMRIEDFRQMVGELPLCKACFDGDYPTEVPEEKVSR